MQWSAARSGRVFILRLEDGEILHETIEAFAAVAGIRRATVIVLGGAAAGSRLVVGPVDGAARPVTPQETTLADVHEIAGVGTLFPDESNQPVLHLHVACGRQCATTTGCVRRGVRIWQVAEVVVTELLDTAAARRADPATGFHLLQP